MGAPLRLEGSLTLRRAIQQVQRELDDVERGGGRMRRDLVREVGEFDGKQNEQAFKSEGALSGKAWPALGATAPNGRAYARWKERVRPGRKILVFDGDLRRSLRNASDRFREVHLRGRTLLLGTSHPVAGYHQDGHSKGYFPPRPPVRKSKKQKQQLKLSITHVVARRVSNVLGAKTGIGRSFRVFVGRLQRPNPRIG